MQADSLAGRIIGALARTPSAASSPTARSYRGNAATTKAGPGRGLSSGNAIGRLIGALARTEVPVTRPAARLGSGPAPADLPAAPPVTRDRPAGDRARHQTGSGVIEAPTAVAALAIRVNPVPVSRLPSTEPVLAGVPTGAAQLTIELLLVPDTSSPGLPGQSSGGRPEEGQR